MKQPRAGIRIPLELSARVRWKSPRGSPRQVEGKTCNISGNGLLVTLPIRPRPKTSIAIVVSLPSELTHVPVELSCQGRVVRWEQKGNHRGMGAIIDEYELRPVGRRPRGSLSQGLSCP
jgi:hypothetical protein